MKKRVLSAVVMLLLFIPLTIVGKIPFLVLCCVLGLLALKDFLDLEKKIPFLFKFSACFFTLFMIIYNYKDTTIAYLLNYKFMIILSLFYFLGIVIVADHKKYNYKDALFLIGAILLTGFVFNSFVIVRNSGVEQIFYLFLIATITDTFAYFVGSLFGKHKLSPNLSPNKTIEGSIGGTLFATVIVSVIYVWYMNTWDSLSVVMLTTLFLSILGQCGDLFFSSIKRFYKIKDFSNLIPGHGGILDRLDSVIFVILGYILILL